MSYIANRAVKIKFVEFGLINLWYNGLIMVERKTESEQANFDIIVLLVLIKMSLTCDRTGGFKDGFPLPQSHSPSKLSLVMLRHFNHLE